MTAATAQLKSSRMPAGFRCALYAPKFGEDRRQERIAAGQRHDQPDASTHS
jgi:hypothetical protein